MELSCAWHGSRPPARKSSRASPLGSASLLPVYCLACGREPTGTRLKPSATTAPPVQGQQQGLIRPAQKLCAPRIQLDGGRVTGFDHGGVAACAMAGLP